MSMPNADYEGQIKARDVVSLTFYVSVLKLFIDLNFTHLKMKSFWLVYRSGFILLTQGYQFDGPREDCHHMGWNWDDHKKCCHKHHKKHCYNEQGQDIN